MARPIYQYRPVNNNPDQAIGIKLPFNKSANSRTTVNGHYASGSANGGGVFVSPSLHGRKNNNKSVADSFGCWALVSHSENCRTKTIEGQMGRRHRRRNHHDVARESNSLPYRLDRRYIELKLVSCDLE